MENSPYKFLGKFRSLTDDELQKPTNYGLAKRYGRGAVQSGLTHECGVFGAMACGDWPTQLDIAQIVCLGLVALQHRGQESAGIVTSEGHCTKNFNVCKGMGMISSIFTDEAIKKLRGNLGIGHTRYSTSASSEEVNCQPFVVHTAHGAMAVAHNGELVNCESLRRNVLSRGVGLSTHSDSELITQALCLNPPEGEVGRSDHRPTAVVISGGDEFLKEIKIFFYLLDDFGIN